jgi:hypothetical protein
MIILTKAVNKQISVFLKLSNNQNSRIHFNIGSYFLYALLAITNFITYPAMQNNEGVYALADSRLILELSD